MADEYKFFPWRPKAAPNITNNTEVTEVAFGDGYEQVAPPGLNYNRKQYALEYRIIGPVDKQRFIDFYDEHGKHKAFSFYSDSRMKRLLVRFVSCTEKPNHGANYCDFSVTVKEVIL